MEKYKNIIIGILILTLIGFYVFNTTNPLDGYGEELSELKKANELLTRKNDSIMLLNNKLDKRIKDLNIVISTKESELNDTKVKLKELQDGKAKVGVFVDNLDIDGVDRALTDYLETRQD